MSWSDLDLTFDLTVVVFVPIIFVNLCETFPYQHLQNLKMFAKKFVWPVS